jgi:hypothetical protein
MTDQLSYFPDENSKRFVALLNAKIDSGRLFNALGHMAAGLASRFDASELCFLEYRDASGGSHPAISHFPFIVLKADNSNQIFRLRQIAIERSIQFTDFAGTMSIGTSAEQLSATARTPESDLEYFGICLFAETETLRELTKRFSLYK